MPHFRYEGRDQSGKTCVGTVEAKKTEDVAEQIMQIGITPIKIIEVRAPIQLPGLLDFLQRRKVKNEEMLLFCRQMHSLVKAGVSITTALTRLSEILLNPTLAQTLKVITTQLNAGESLSSAMRHYPKIFSHLLIALVTAGEANGRLDEAFFQAAKHYELETTTRRRVKAVMRYPLFVMIVVAGAITILNLFVIPKFSQLYSSFHATLPLPTRVLINTSNFFYNYWYVLILVLLFCFLGATYALKNPVWREKIDRYQFKMPIFGSIIERGTMASFSSSLAMLLKTGVPLIHALTLTADIVGNSYARNKILMMRNSIERGDTLEKAAKQAQFFSPLVLQMISVGEETGNVDKMLLEISVFFESEIDYDIKQLADKMEPVLLIAVGGVVLILALGVFLPMWDMVYVVK